MAREQELLTWVRGRLQLFDHELDRLPPRPGKVVVGFDGSGSSLMAASWAALIAEEIHIAIALSQRGAQTGPLGRQEALDWGAGIRATIDNAQPELVERLADRRVVEHEVDESPAPAVMQIARRVDAGMILVGRKAKGWLDRTALGSVSEGLLSNAKRTTLIAGEEPEEAQGPVLVGVGPDTGSLLAAAWGAGLALWLDRDLILAHADLDDDQAGDWESQGPRAQGVGVEWPARKGILDLAEARDASLVVVGHGPATGWLGDTALGVARGSSRGVVVARPWTQAGPDQEP